MNSITRDNPRFDDDKIIEIARSVEPHDFERIAPPAQVWNNVLAEFEVAVAAEEATARRQQRQWFSSARVLSAAAVAVLLVGVAVIALANRSGNTDVQQVASATMSDEGLPVSTTESASAVVICEGDNECYVEVDLTALPNAGEGDLELWVINEDVSDMHSLGLVTNSGRFELPFGITTEEFPIVDISVEPRDGVEAHSGQSVLRGVFDQA